MTSTVPPLRLGFASTPLPHYMGERKGGGALGSLPRPLQGERCRAKRVGEGVFAGEYGSHP
jgi:hypothetical protein